MMFILFVFLSIFTGISSLNSPCADQLQRCGLLVEEFERQLNDLKNSAFRSCFPKGCIHEKVAFDDCFAKSLQAVRGPFVDVSQNQIKNDFSSAANDFQSEVEQCFDNGGKTAEPAEINTTTSDSSQLIGAIFGIELADRLWGLPNGELDRKEKETIPQSTCNFKATNNLTTACILDVSELACFKRALDYDPQYRTLMSSLDRTLHSCIQNTRLQSEATCQMKASSKMRSCICNARQAVDARMQSAILECVQHSPVAQLYAALVSLSFSSPSQTVSSPRLRPIDTTNFPPLPDTSFQSEEAMSLPSNGAVLTQGETNTSL
uniref:Uncharacterized protein n=1 Tax=Meloidogyne enterolobii TaxID=390850 RepID=A0A6V7WYZ9_MELEN|nr:unnamed protein product [Meloidogyne enterolobii]